MTACPASGPPSAQVSETDFGAEKVRSKPGTDPLPRTPWLPSSGEPSTGLRPVSIAVSWSAPTSPDSSSSREASPAHCPATSPSPE